MEKEKRIGSTVALLFLCPALIGALSGCSQNCDSNGSTLTTTDDCGTGRRGTSSGGFFGGGRARSGASSIGESGARSGGFGGFGHAFGGGHSGS